MLKFRPPGVNLSKVINKWSLVALSMLCHEELALPMASAALLLLLSTP
jgi:hypothetical protein